MHRAWARWRELGFREKKWLLAMLILLPFVSALLRLFGFNRSHAWLLRSSRNSEFNQPNTQALEAAERLALIANIAGRRGAVTATCLRQAMLLEWWLRRRGLDAKLKLGARLQEGQFDAHAWVELEGRALGQGELQHRAFSDI